MADLKAIRRQIDRLDDALCELLKERLKVMAEVAEAKRQSGGPVYDPAREREIMNKMMEMAGPEYEAEIRLIFSTLLSMGKNQQRLLLNDVPPLIKDIDAACKEDKSFPLRAMVACPGTEGSYSQQAAERFFQAPTILYFNSFEKVFQAVEQGLCKYGILPVENSAAGSVAAVYDAMAKHKFHIVKSLRQRIGHVLLGLPGSKLENLTAVASHPHALAQCGKFLAQHNSWQLIPSANTAVAARELNELKNPKLGVIASRRCAELYNLEVLAEDISDTENNYTRFICISRDLEIFRGAKKLSIMLILPHHPGALNNLLSRFAALEINLTKLESRPIPGMDFEFLFAFDFEASPRDENVLRLLTELVLDPEITRFTFLGAYGEE